MSARVWRAAALAAALASTLAACASDPGYAAMNAEAGQYFGYSDAPNSMGGHTIRVVLPAGVSDPRSAFAHWERRAAELCAPLGYRKQISYAERHMLYAQGAAPAAMYFEVLGDAYCEPAAPVMAAAEAP